MTVAGESHALLHLLFEEFGLFYLVGQITRRVLGVAVGVLVPALSAYQAAAFAKLLG